MWFESRQPDFSVFFSTSFGQKSFRKDGAVLTLKSTSSAGLSGTTYAIDNSAVGYINNSTLVILGKGTATITATNPGNGIYNPTSATQTLIVK